MKTTELLKNIGTTHVNFWRTQLINKNENNIASIFLNLLPLITSFARCEEYLS